MSFEVANAIYRNALRLFDDGELLMEHGRFASATALFISSAEEIGKLCDILTHKLGASSTTNKSGRNHTHRHNRVMISHYSSAGLAAAETYFRSIGYKLVKEEDVPAGLQGVKLSITDALLATFTDQNFPIYHEALQKEFARAAWVVSASRDAHQARMRSLYLDYTGDEVVSTPLEISREEAESWRRYASDTLELVDVAPNGRVRVVRLPTDPQEQGNLAPAIEPPDSSLIGMLRQDEDDPDVDFEPPLMEIKFVLADFSGEDEESS